VYYVWLGVLCAGLFGLAAGAQEISSPTAAIVQSSDVVVQAKWKRLPAEGPVHHAMRKAHIDSQKPGSAVIICETAKPDRVVNCEESYNTPGTKYGQGLILAAPRFRIMPPVINGVPQFGAKVTIRFTFDWAKREGSPWRSRLF
jgi:hypothetical protein